MSDDFITFIVMPLAIIGTLAAIATGATAVGLRTWGHGQQIRKCAVYATETGRETRFVDYTWWEYGCLAKSADGKWIPIEQLREVTQ